MSDSVQGDAHDESNLFLTSRQSVEEVELVLGLPSGWADACLGDVCKVQGGYAFKSKEYTTSGVPLVRIGDLVDGKVKIDDKTVFLPISFVEQNAKFELHKGDVLMALSGATTGKIAEYDREDVALLNQRVGRFLPYDTDLYSRSFLLLQVARIVDEIRERAYGGAQPNISPTAIESTSIATPPFPEQRRIVSAIESLQARSSRAKQALSEVGPLLSQLRQSVLRSAFNGDLTADWRAQNPHVEPASELLARIRTERRERWEAEQLAKYEEKGKKPPKNWQDKYKEPEPVDESELEQLPEGWCWISLEEMVPYEFPVVYGIIQAGPHVPDGVPYIRPADIKESKVNIEDLPRTTPEIAEKYERASLKSGDLIYSVVGTIGKTLIVDERLDGANITQSSVRIRLFKPFTSQMILHALQSPLVTQQMDELKFGVAVQRLNVGHMRQLAIPVPPIEEWRRISEIVDDMFAGLDHIKEISLSLKLALTNLDQSILAKAFRGELVPQDPSDEPASELLKRIRQKREAEEAEKKAAKAAAKKKTNRTKKTKAK